MRWNKSFSVSAGCYVSPSYFSIFVSVKEPSDVVLHLNKSSLVSESSRLIACLIIKQPCFFSNVDLKRNYIDVIDSSIGLRFLLIIQRISKPMPSGTYVHAF